MESETIAPTRRTGNDAGGSENGTGAGAKRLILADPLLPDGLELLAAEPDLSVEDLADSDRPALLSAIRGAAGLIVRSRTRVDAELLEAADSLEVIGRAGVGVDNIDIEAATRRGIAVLNAPSANTFSTAELTIGLMLAVARRIPTGDQTIRKGRWERKALKGTQLVGKRLGVIGAGRIGAEVIRRARGLGMRVVVHDPFVTAERINDLGLDLVELGELLAESDVVSLHAPLVDSTRDMIGRSELAAMKETAYLVNAARGGLVDEEALAEALEGGRLAGAALDVFESEPLPEAHPLRRAPNTVFTPHLGASTLEAQQEVSREIARAVRDALLRHDYQRALNAPYAEPGDETRMAPVMELARRLGALLAELLEGRCRHIEVRYAGSVDGLLRPLAAAALEGFLCTTVDPPLNLVNALSVATERGIDVGRMRVAELADYTNYVELIGSGEADVAVGGALLGDGQHARIVRIGDFHVDTVPEGVLLLVRNQDVPGVIGDVGTLLGAAGINIAEYHQSRRAAGGDALGLITVDGQVPEDVVNELRALSAVENVRQVIFQR